MSAATSSSETTFEQAMERLEEIVSQMEANRLPLDEMIVSYDEGMQLLQVCRQRIETARLRVEQISTKAEGRATLTPFDPSAQPVEETAKPAAAPRRRKSEADDTSGDDIRLF